jgi:Putative Flp pilus-assembly TadE/G-like
MRHRARDERGQAFALMVIALIALLGTGAIVMDVGFAWYAKRQVQASADAAALAGAQELPDVAAATSRANQYAGLNTPDNLNNINVAVTTRCSVTATNGNWCGPGKAYQANTIAVTETGSTPTWFAKIFGINKFDVKGVATACQPCSSSPADIMIVLDRTGSMCSPTGPGNVCIDLNNAKDGIQTLFNIMDPNIDTVGMVALPPYNNTGANAVCGNASTSNTVTINGKSVIPSNYDQANLVYLNDPLASDFKTSATSPLNPSSSLVKHTTDDTSGVRNCIQSFGSTSYDEALKAGQAELDADGRPGVPKYLIFMTDGEANLGGYWAGVAGHGYEPDLGDPATGFDMSPAGTASTINPGDAQPCHNAINVANTIKASGTTIYSIGYALGQANCVHGVWGQVDASQAANQNDWTNFVCTAIGSPAIKTNSPARSWDLAPSNSLRPAHLQGIYTAPPTAANNTNGNMNPCTNKLVYDSTLNQYVNPHDELPRITSYTTVQTIASPGDFYNKATPGDLTTIFASIAADITKGTSRLVDDSY